MDYYIENGDGTDARIWSDWCNLTGTTYTYATLSHADSVLLTEPGAGQNYFPDVRGVWHTYTCDVTAPATTGGTSNLPITSMSFQFRTYKTPAVVDWDNMYFGVKPTGLNSLAADKLEVTLAGNKLTVTNASTKDVEIFNTVGAKVQTLKLVDGSADLNLVKGVYVAKAGNQTAKIMIK